MSVPTHIDPILDHIGLAAVDPDKTIAFYLTLLEGREEKLGMHSIVRSGSLALAVVPRGEGGAPPRELHLALRFPSGARSVLLERLVSLGARCQEVGERLYLHDPDGMVLELLVG